jgi:hypothetical protein
MKKIIFSVVSVVVIAAITSLIFFSNGCSKDTKLASNDEESNSISLRSATMNSATIQIECAGTCENNEICGARWNIPDGIIECTCSGCVMSIKKDNVSNRSTSSRADMPKIAAHFVDYIKRTHNTEDYLITSYKQTFYDLAEFIEIQYIVNNNPSETFSLTFLAKFESSDLRAAPTNTVLVDCHGSCDTSAEKCVEVYNTNTGEVYCKCQSDNCKMKIEEVKSN